MSNNNGTPGAPSNVTYVDFSKVKSSETSTKSAAMRPRKLRVLQDLKPQPGAGVVPLFDRNLSFTNWLADHAAAETERRRFERARSYVADDRVNDITITDNFIGASVSGTQLEPFSVSLIFPKRTPQQLHTIVQTLERNPQALAAAYEGKLPQSISELLFARADEAVRADCDCPDRPEYCKHVAAVCLAAAALIASVPAKAFALRGIELSELRASDAPQPTQPDATSAAPTTSENSQVASSQTAAEPEENWEERFWYGTPLPAIPSVPYTDFFRKADEQPLRRALKHVSSSPVEQVRAFADLEDIYAYLESVAKEADRWALGGDDDPERSRDEGID